MCWSFEASKLWAAEVIMNGWNDEVLKHWSLKINEALKQWNTEAFKCWRYWRHGSIALKRWSAEALEYLSINALKHCNVETLKSWSFEVLKGWSDEGWKPSITSAKPFNHWTNRKHYYARKHWIPKRHIKLWKLYSSYWSSVGLLKERSMKPFLQLSNR